MPPSPSTCPCPLSAAPSEPPGLGPSPSSRPANSGPIPSIENSFLKVSLTENPPQILLRDRKGQVLLRVCGGTVLDAIKRTKVFLDAREQESKPTP